MSGELLKYIGTYRVMADMDLDKHDFPRNDEGELDPDFNDYYLPCKRGNQIRSAGKGQLIAYIFSTKYAKSVATKAEYSGLKLVEVDIMDGEGAITFNVKDIAWFAKELGATTKNSRQNPTPVKNLTKKGGK